eukprot:4141607-Pyramimonas_sp.AAC.1
MLAAALASAAPQPNECCLVHMGARRLILPPPGSPASVKRMRTSQAQGGPGMFQGGPEPAGPGKAPESPRWPQGPCRWLRRALKGFRRLQ